ncbi:MAG: DUF4430 domain-containing protein [Clostridia bacterium]|nr:DUF4430 domain-containing protein [Clostridia bacterium]
MTNFNMKNILSLVVATVLLAAMVLCATSCDKASGEEITTTTAASEAAPPIEIGEGATAFTFEITHMDGSQKTYAVKTDAQTVGEALVSLGLIAGEDGAYGLYVKTVDGETVDWDTHQKYWAFYENGAMAMNGVDKTNVVAGATYAFRVE